MPNGLIVKALSGFYYVLPDGAGAIDPAGTQTLVQCRARGVFKKKGISPLVGDHVVYEATENGEGTVTEILPRFSELIRPPIANVHVAVLAFAVTEPELNFQLLDKFLVHTEKAGLQTVICLTKSDKLEFMEKGPEKDRLKALVEEAVRLYEKIGYRVVRTSSRANLGKDEVLGILSGTIGVFAGQSGVGKSSMLNMLIPGLRLETNEISMKLGRGKHTTRHVELIRLPGEGWVADTPGFSQLDFQNMEPEQLSACFREMAELSSGCKFRGCLHQNEPHCKVRGALEQGEVAQSRYDNYIQFLEEIKETWKRRY